MRVSYSVVRTKQSLKDCLDVRREVFIVGQNVPEALEVDGLDDTAIHFMAEYKGQVIGTARARILENGIAKIERVAVLDGYRGQSIGQGLMEFIMNDLQQRPEVKKLKLSSQTYVIPFYERLGFCADGAEYMDADIPHYDMFLSV